MAKNTDVKFEMREKKRWYVLLSLSLIFFSIFLIVRYPNSVTIEKKIMTIIVSIDEKNQKIVADISENGKKFAQKNISFNPNNTYDLSAVIELIKKYQVDNWKTINSTMEVRIGKEENKTMFYFFMQK
ncbi:MAG: hypothetical protein EAZ85_08850 [Bacteroidetes bacterium]|nr:MAG: hypothetical protein EAZ85_08850 [Bacteroidota bacterium]